jgi:hypothetical protein
MLVGREQCTNDIITQSYKIIGFTIEKVEYLQQQESGKNPSLLHNQ